VANRLTMATVSAILALHRSGHSNRKIARLLGVHRETVAEYVRAAELQNRPKAPTGSDGRTSQGQTPLAETSELPLECAPAPPLRDGTFEVCPESQGAGVHESNKRQSWPAPGPASQCEPFRELITGKVEAGLSAVRIYQDLVEQGFEGKYWSVRRYVGRLTASRELPMRRLETLPGDEAQIDFGIGAPVLMPDGKRRRPWIFRVVLSHSRKAYSQAVWRQTTEAFLQCLENAFHAFGGVPRRLVLDNLKAAVAQADWYDPEVHPKLQSFASHYGTAFLPTKPYTPRHKGKIERGIGYAKNNALKARVFQSLEEENQFLLRWEETVADTRIHGTTKRQVGRMFQDTERAALLPLPADCFPFFHEASRAVHRDGHLEVDKAYYSAPPEYVGRRLWVRWDARLVRIFNDRFEQVAVHAKVEPGRFRTAAEHIPQEKVSAVERGTDALLRQIAAIGPHTRQWAEATTQIRGVEAVRVLVGLKALAGKYPSDLLDAACRSALAHGAHRLRTIRQLLKRSNGQEQQQFAFLQEHPIIRPLTDYSLASLLQFRRERHSNERNTN
jgi:transposase